MTPDNLSPVDKLASALQPLPDVVRGLRADVHAGEAARKKANSLNTLLLVIAVVLVAVVGVVGFQNNRLAREVKTTNNHIADCTTAGGQCYEESRRRTGAAVTTLTRISVYVNQCARLWPDQSGPEYDRNLERCVGERIAAGAAAGGQPGG